MTQSPLSRYMAEQNARPVHVTRRRTLRGDLQDLWEWLSGRHLWVSSCCQALLYCQASGDGSTPESHCTDCGKPCTPVYPAPGTVWRIRWNALWTWAGRVAAPGWMLAAVLTVVVGLYALRTAATVQTMIRVCQTLQTP